MNLENYFNEKFDNYMINSEKDFKKIKQKINQIKFESFKQM